MVRMTWTLPSAILFLLLLLLLLGYVLSRKVFPAGGDTPDEEASPGGIDCESCGEAGCGGFAKALVRGGQEGSCTLDKNRAGGEEIKAFVHCRGRRVTMRYRYSGGLSCKVASGMPVRPRSCDEACLGYGDCTGACQHRAILVRKGLAWIDPALCTGCGDCVKACPVGIIRMIPAIPGLGIACSRPQSKSENRPCLDGCTRCGDCVKACPENALTLPPEKLPLLNPALCNRCGECVNACPEDIFSLLIPPAPRKEASQGS
jgi:electron transport complex protein RnfB